MKTTSKLPAFFESLTPRDILQAIWRRVHWLVLTTVLMYGIVAIVVWHLPDSYRAQTLIMIDPQKVPERYVAATVNADVGSRLSTISQEVLSSTRLQRVIDTYGLYKNLQGRLTQEETIELMRKDTSVEVVHNFEGVSRGLGAFRISYSGRSPETVAQVCNQLASMVIDQNLKVREQQAEGTSEFLDAQLAVAKQKLEEQEGKLRDFKLKHVGELPEQSNANVATLGRLQAGLQAETEALNRARQQEVYLQSLLGNVEPSAAEAAPALGEQKDERGSKGGGGSVPRSSAAVSPELLRLRQLRAGLADRLDQLQARYSDDHPDVQRAQSELRSVDRQITAEEKSLAAQAAGEASNRPVLSAVPGVSAAAARRPEVTLRAQLDLVQDEIKNRQATQNQISKQITVYQAKMDAMPVREQEIVNVVRDYEMSKTFYQALLEKKMGADMAADLEKRQKSERFTVLDPARIPEKPYRPNRPALNLIGAVAAVTLGIVLVFLLELRDDLLRKEGELAFTGLRVLGRLPLLAMAGEMRLKRRKNMIRWALGTAGTVITLLIINFAAAFLVQRLPY